MPIDNQKPGFAGIPHTEEVQEPKDPERGLQGVSSGVDKTDVELLTHAIKTDEKKEGKELAQLAEKLNDKGGNPELRR